MTKTLVNVSQYYMFPRLALTFIINLPTVLFCAVIIKLRFQGAILYLLPAFD